MRARVSILLLATFVLVSSSRASDFEVPPPPDAELEVGAPDTRRAPYRRFKDQTLEYHGPSDGQVVGADDQPIQIAWFGPSSADEKPHGDLWWSAQLAVAEANRRGGIRHRLVRLVPVGSENPWGTGVARLFRLIYDQPVVAVLGSIDGASTHLAEQIVAKARLPLVSPIASDDSVNLAGVPWVFSCSPSDQTIAQVLTKSILEDLQSAPRSEVRQSRSKGGGEVACCGESQTRAPSPTESLDADRQGNGIALLSATDHDSRAAMGALLQEFGRQGLTVGLKLEFPPDTSDFHRQLDAIRQAEPMAIVLAAGPGSSARILQALHEASTTIPIYATQHAGRRQSNRVARPENLGLRYVDLTSRTCDHEARGSFASRYRTQFARDPDFATLLTYDAARVLLEAIRRAGPDRVAIRDALAELSPWLGTCGPVSWDGTGRNTRRPEGLAVSASVAASRNLP